MKNLPLVFIINGHQPFVYHQDGESGFAEYRFFESLSDTYLPLLRSFMHLETEGIPFKLGLCLSPQLCAMMDDKSLCSKYTEFLDWQASFIEEEKSRNNGNVQILRLLDSYLAENRLNRSDFSVTYGNNILDKFKYYADRGFIELLGTAASSAFLPLYEDMPEVLSAQIEMGLTLHHKYFKQTPAGFWLPYMGYASGLEFPLKEFGYTYTVLAAHGVLFGNPVPQNGIFAPVNFPNKFSAWGTDPAAVSDVGNFEKGFHVQNAYRNQERDVLFELDSDRISAGQQRYYSGIKYWNNDGTVYDLCAAAQTVQKDAETFLAKRFAVLKEASLYMSELPVSVCPLSAEMFGRSWHEGITWLETVFRMLDRGTFADDQAELIASLPNYQLQQTLERNRVCPMHSSSADDGYAESWLDSSNEWMCRFSRTAAANMVDLATRFSGDAGLKERALNLAAREVLLSQDAELPLMVKNMMYADFALARFEESISSFSIVYDFLGANTMSTEWLTDLERHHNVFERINFRIFESRN